MRKIILMGLATYAAMISTAQADDYCREFTQMVAVGGQLQQGYGTACLQPDGSWQIVSQPVISQPIVQNTFIAPPPMVRYVPVYSPPVRTFSIVWQSDRPRRYDRPMHHRAIARHRRSHYVHY